MWVGCVVAINPDDAGRGFQSISDVTITGLSSGIPATTFDGVQFDHANSFTAPAKNLGSLELSIMSRAWNSESANEVANVAQFFREVTILESLALFLAGRTIIRSLRYRLDQIFKPVVRWFRPALKTLNIFLISAFYKDLTRLLLYSLPSLRGLLLTQVWLLDQKWEEIVEGLRHIVPLKQCMLLHLLQSDQTPYNSNSVHNVDEAKEFYAVNGRYIVEGGTHPCAPA